MQGFTSQQNYFLHLPTKQLWANGRAKDVLGTINNKHVPNIKASHMIKATILRPIARNQVTAKTLLIIRAEEARAMIRYVRILSLDKWQRHTKTAKPTTIENSIESMDHYNFRECNELPTTKSHRMSHSLSSSFPFSRSNLQKYPKITKHLYMHLWHECRKNRSSPLFPPSGLANSIWFNMTALNSILLSPKNKHSSSQQMH